MASRSSRSRTVVPFTPPTPAPAPAPAPALPGVCVGVVAGFDGERVMVDFPGNVAGPVAARLLVGLDAAALAAAASSRQAVGLVFEAGDVGKPLIVGLVAPGPTAAPREVRVDGRKVVLAGEEEVELRCGEASISLKKNGKLVIRGAYVETRAKGTNRIKGGSVQIN